MQRGAAVIERKVKRMTNADKIRGMSNKDLTYLLCDVKRDYGQYISIYPDGDGLEDWMEWLREEVEEE